MPSKSKVSVATSGGKRSFQVVSPKQWLAARTSLLAKEKKFTKLLDQLNRQRRALPWEKVEKDYVFDAPGRRKVSLSQLFEGRRQLIVYHFMFGPDWKQGCKHCSFWVDHFDATVPHLSGRDTSFVAISRAPISKIEPFKMRMGWRFKWVSSGGNDFNYDLGVSFNEADVEAGKAFYNYEKLDDYFADREGLSVFFKDDAGAIYHTYSTFARGIDLLNGTYNVLDLVPKGRDEEDEEFSQFWVRYHDEYEE